jgi:hypothetical protein
MFARCRFIALIILALTLSGCSLTSLNIFQPQPTPAGTVRPKFINHAAPSQRMDLKPFTDAGCKPDPEGHLRCPTIAPFDQMGCDEIIEAPPLFGALTPAVPIMQCMIEPSDPNFKMAENTFLYSTGCTQTTTYMRYIVYQNGKFRLIKMSSELKSVYEPIDTPDEALAYAMARTGYQAYFGLKDSNMRYLVNQIEDTTAVPGGEGFLVNLFSFEPCGCAPHVMSKVVVEVSLRGVGGGIKILSTTPLWEDPTQDNVCND